MALVKTRTEYLNLRVYIEGVEIPSISATVTHAVHGSSTAYVQIIGTEAALDLRPRSIVEVYVKSDENRTLSEVSRIPLYKYNGSEGVSRKFANPNSGIADGNLGVFADSGYTVTAAEAQNELDYDLIFLGELSGYTFYEDSQSRTINLLCTDFSNHLDSITQYTYDTTTPLSMGGHSRLTLLSGFVDSSITQAAYASTAGGPTLLTEASGQEDLTKSAGTDNGGVASFNLDTIIGGVIGLDQRITKLLGGLGLGMGMKAIFNSVAKSYVYYRDLDEELNLRDHVYVAEDDTARRLYQQAVYIDYIFGYQNRYGSLNSLKNLIKIVFKLTSFEFVPLPGQPFMEIKDFDAVLTKSQEGEKTSQQITTEDLIAEEAKLTDKDTVASAKSTLLKPELLFAEPPACNIIFPDEMYSMNVSRHFLSEPTRGIDQTDSVVANDAYDSAIGSISNTFAISPSLLINEAGEVISYAPLEMVNLANNVGKDLAEFGRILLPEEVFKGIIPLNSKTGHLLRSAYLSVYTGGDADLTFLTGKGTFDFSQLSPATQKKLTELQKESRQFYLRETNYKFLKARFQARTAQASCKFLPRLVPGFPALISEKVPRANSSNFTKKVRDKNTGDMVEVPSYYFGHFGHIIQLTHFVSQGGGVTSVQMSHVRPTNEKIDIFTDVDHSAETFDAGASSILPDYREMGVVPWGTAQRDGGFGPYHPQTIHKKYAEWLGGMTWKGANVKDKATAQATNYLGVLPISLAVAQTKILSVSPETKAFAADDAALQKNYLNIIRQMFLTYQRNVASPEGDSIEAFYAFLGRRPMANRLQVRGYLNAYFSTVKHGTVKSYSSATVAVRELQKFLLVNGNYSDQDRKRIDGDWGTDSVNALKKYQADNGLRVDGVYGPNTEKSVNDDVVLNKDGKLTDEDKKTWSEKTSASNTKTVNNRLNRRSKRLRAVIDYRDSLAGIGKGYRG